MNSFWFYIVEATFIIPSKNPDWSKKKNTITPITITKRAIILVTNLIIKYIRAIAPIASKTLEGTRANMFFINSTIRPNNATIMSIE